MEGKSCMQDEWIRALKKMTYGIYVLTTSHQGAINGMIASWVAQVSYEPLLIMVAVHPNRYSHRLIEQSGCFVLNVPAREQAEFLERFKGADPAAKFASLAWKRGKTGCPVLKDCVAYFECRLNAKFSPGNHTLFIGEVVHAELLSGQTPFSSNDFDGIYLGKK